MTRFLRVAPDGTTILAVLTMRESDALKNIGPGEFLYAVLPETDTGQTINDATVVVSDGALAGDGAPDGLMVERVTV